MPQIVAEHLLLYETPHNSTATKINESHRVDKTSGRKDPQVNDLDGIAANDVDEDTGEQ